VPHPLHELRPFGSADLTETLLRAGVRRAGPVLSFRYVLRAPAGHWRLPDPQAGAKRADRLWEHTCFEAFLAPAGAAAYWELNVSPSGDWNVYRFEGYRENMEPEGRAQPPVVRVDRATCGTLTLHAEFDMGSITELRSTSLEVGIAAVLEADGGALAYWALSHATPKPDFHRRASFLVRLGAEEPG
jgi:hypothetical protein